MLIRADARRIPLVDGCVQCVVTSPPYWSLRDYGHAGQIGLEGSPDAYVSTLVAVFAEVRRVLKDDGTCWLNLGDSYIGSGMTGGTDSKEGSTKRADRMFHGNRRDTVAGFKQKDLAGIPWRVAFALQADGWYLRSDIIWSKPNPMPESVTDRPTKAHEYIFLLTKSERYYYDADAVAEPASAAMLSQMEQGYNGLGLKDYESAGVQNPSSVKARIIANAKAKYKAANIPGQQPHGYTQREGGTACADNAVTRNKRSVWHVATQPYSGSHFATFPEALIEPCILAGSRPGDLVYDPFIGSGTTGAVADRLMRRWVGTDLSYQQLAKKRTRQRGLRMEASA